MISNLITTIMFEKASEYISANSFAELVTMAGQGDISSRGAKDILSLLFKEKDSSPKSLAEKHNLLQKSDAGELILAIDKILSENPEPISQYKAGKTASLQFLIGQAMRLTKGSANPEVIKKLLLERLSS